MALLSVDEKDWLQEQIRLEYEYSETNSTTDKAWGQLRNAWKEYDMAKHDGNGTKMKQYAAQIERMQGQINIRVQSHINNRD
jgi:hypothetical protein